MARITYDSTQALRQVQQSLKKLFADRRKEIIDAAVAQYRDEMEKKMPEIALFVEKCARPERNSHEVQVGVLWKESPND